MSNFANIINKGKQSGGELASSPEIQDAGKPALQQDGKTASQKAGRRSKTKKSEPAVVPVEDPMVSLTVKVPKSWRKHWTISAKQEDTSVAAEVVEALTQRFGKP